jgi:hypothetical protein
LGTAEDLGNASRVDRSFKTAADQYYTHQAREEEPWFSLLCARFSPEAMGPIVQEMKDKKKEWFKVEDEGTAQAQVAAFGYWSPPPTFIRTMTPKALWEKSNHAHQTKTKADNVNAASRSLGFHFNYLSFPGLWMRVEVRGEVGGRAAGLGDGGGSNQLLAYRTFPLSQAELLFDLYLERALPLVSTETGSRISRLSKHTMTLTLVDLAEGKVAKLLELDEEGKTSCYGFGPKCSMHFSQRNQLVLKSRKVGELTCFGVQIMVHMFFRDTLTVLMHFKNVVAVKSHVQSALKGRFC